MTLRADFPAGSPGAVELYSAALVVEVAEAEGGASGVFDHAVDAFGAPVGPCSRAPSRTRTPSGSQWPELSSPRLPARCPPPFKRPRAPSRAEHRRKSAPSRRRAAPIPFLAHASPSTTASNGRDTHGHPGVDLVGVSQETVVAACPGTIANVGQLRASGFFKVEGAARHDLRVVS